ncbi:unnamed protein product (macronuclear) [Paramecium tetraurelia]|uniref:TROVE domain-containing protein n=1 Tax=Paramecium tetraurelia TaxID=5888 RepID=A0BJL0_PARTE|nr:uncharacterized protein GSPATT00029355001 [Paramecium tetraurelia]CAK58727.1 unnamed protein product [Paramecium tetraurelia]|eukprot:XP_001426125.1 hypothetical protein (macronuclear) [Paramecium tetraurelia strain d4-2]
MIPNQLKFFLDPTSCKQRDDPKEYFFSVVASSLLKETKYYETSDGSRDKLIATMNTIANIDPEFILQVAYYVRNQMYIRSISNFILAFSTLHPKTKPFCSTYMCPTMLIPGDLIEVCQFVQVISKYIRKQLQFPKILQKQIQKKLTQFNVYQLGKQCSDGSRKKNIKKYQEILKPDLKDKRREKRLLKLKLIRDQIESQGPDVKTQFEIKAIQKTNRSKKNKGRHMRNPHINQVQEKLNVFDTNFLNLKDIVTFSHVKEPRSLVMSILGVKYPKTLEEFEKEFKEEKKLQFEPERAGKRMSIPIPVTWDRELSKGLNSKRQIWEDLIQKNQVPYLALLRNLRNILKSGVSDEAHLKVVEKLSNLKQVENSKVFPLQFFTALNEIDKLKVNKQSIQKEVKQQREKKERAKEQVKPKKEKKEVQIEEEVDVPPKVIQSYKDAIEKAMKIAVDKNLETISGVTYVFVDVSGSMRSPISGGKKYGSVNQCQDCAFVLAHLIRIKCEKCEFYLFAAPKNNVPYTKVTFENDTLLEGIQRCQQKSGELCGSHEMIGQTINDVLLVPKVRADNVVILSDMMVTQGFSETELSMEKVFKDYLQKVNPEAKFFFMDISGYGQQVSFGDDLKSKNCFLINGMSDNVLKYISYAGKINQLEDVVAFSQELKAKQQVQELKNNAQIAKPQQIETE